jgi:serine/threonine protein kinase
MHDGTNGGNEWFFQTLKEQYRLVRVCSSSSQGEVLQLRHKIHGYDVIKRVYHDYHDLDDVYITSLSIVHPNIPKVYEVVFENGTVTILEEYIDGIAISDVLDSGLYKESGVIAIISSLCDALHILHKN